MKVGPRWTIGVAACGLAVCVASCGDEDGPPALGASCERSEDCAEDLSCDDSLEPTAGMCTRHCENVESCREDFGSNAFCIGAGRCVLGCEAVGDCQSGQTCIEAGWCMRATCTTNEQCWRFACDTAARECMTFCSTDEDCAFGHQCEYGECFDVF